MAETKDKYVYGTAAEKIQYDVYEENKVLKQKRKQRSNNKAKFKMFLHVLFVFMLGIVVVLRYAMITELGYNIEKKSSDFNNIINENSRLKVDIERNMDIASIRDIAEQKLGMQKPDKYQVVYVNVPRNDFSMVSDKYQDSGKAKDGIAALFDKLGNIIDLLY